MPEGKQKLKEILKEPIIVFTTTKTFFILQHFLKVIAIRGLTKI